MTYETPKLTGLTPAINVIQSVSSKNSDFTYDNGVKDETIGTYADWE